MAKNQIHKTGYISVFGAKLSGFRITWSEYPVIQTIRYPIRISIPSRDILKALFCPLYQFQTFFFRAFVRFIDMEGQLYVQTKSQREICKEIERELELFYGQLPVQDCDLKWETGDICIAKYPFEKESFWRILLRLLRSI